MKPCQLVLSIVVLSVLQIACSRKIEKVVIDRGPSNQNHKPFTASAPERGELTRAAANGDLAQVEALVTRGALIDENVSTGSYPLTPLMSAIVRGHATVAEFLVSKGADTSLRYRGYSIEELAVHAFSETAPVVTQIRVLHKAGKK